MTNKVQRALISVSDKRGVENFARALAQAGIELLSTGGTHATLSRAGLQVKEVSEHTGFPEMLDGRVKTLHPAIHGGILALRDRAEHTAALERHAIEPIDLVVVNLYPFEATVARAACSFEEAIENIDIGGPSMVRSAAKNQRFVGVVTDPDDYGRVLDELERGTGALSEAFKRELAAKAFALTARYDAAIAAWLHGRQRHAGSTPFPETLVLAATRCAELRYGENPHQRAALYRAAGARGPSLAAAELLGGKQLSHNNLVDLDAALGLAREFDQPFVAVLKHNNPCGAAAAATLREALELAWEGDPLSAFGSVLACTRAVDLPCAEYLAAGNRFVEAVVAPGFEPEALRLLVEKPKWGRSVRLLAVERKDALWGAPALELEPLDGGFLLQERDEAVEGEGDCRVVTRRAPDAAELSGLLFAARICKHVKSNAIVLARGTQVVGVGAGQMSRVDAVHLALRKAGGRARGAVLASDAFFPFADGPQLALQAGVTALLQPGGSVRDTETVAACNEAGAAMVFTGRRHFRH